MNSKQRNQQRRKYIREVKQRIEDDEYELFTSHQIIDDCGFVDFLFIGEHKDKTVIWNACITTARGDYYEHVNDIAMDEGYEKYPTPEDYEPFKSEPCAWDKKGKPTMYKMVEQPEFAEYIDKRYRWIAERTIELLNSKTISISSFHVEIDESYKYGTGLHIRVDRDHINVCDVERFIHQFNNCEYEPHTKDICLSANDLGVELKDDSRFVTWSRPFSHNTVAIDETKLNL